LAQACAVMFLGFVLLFAFAIAARD